MNCSIPDHEPLPLPTEEGSTSDKFYEQRQKDERKNEGFRDVLAMSRDPKMRFMLPLIIFQGILVSSSSSLYLNLWTFILKTNPDEALSDKQVLAMSMNTFVSYASGQILGSQMVGQLIDKAGYKNAIVFLLLTVALSNGVLLWQILATQFNALSFVCMFGLGVADHGNFTFENTILGFEFESKITPFGFKLLVENLVIFVAVAVLSQASLKTNAVYLGFFSIQVAWGVVAYILMLWFPFKQKPRKD